MAGEKSCLSNGNRQLIESENITISRAANESIQTIKRSNKCSSISNVGPLTVVPEGHNKLYTMRENPYILHKHMKLFIYMCCGVLAMKDFVRLTGLSLITLVCGVTSAWAETRYISDQLIVSLREQPRQGAESITYLRSDTAVDVLEESAEYIKVQTAAGDVGYIKQNYLTKEIPKSVIIKRLQKERDRLVTQANEAKQQAATITSQSDMSQRELTTQLSEIGKENRLLQDKLASSQAELKKISQSYRALQENARNVVSITRERDQLRQTNQELTAAITTLDDEVSSLTRTGVIKWFLAGGGVLFSGWIIGKLSGGRRRHRY